MNNTITLTEVAEHFRAAGVTDFLDKHNAQMAMETAGPPYVKFLNGAFTTYPTFDGRTPSPVQTSGVAYVYGDNIYHPLSIIYAHSVKTVKRDGEFHQVDEYGRYIAGTWRYGMARWEQAIISASSVVLSQPPVAVPMEVVTLEMTAAQIETAVWMFDLLAKQGVKVTLSPG